MNPIILWIKLRLVRFMTTHKMVMYYLKLRLVRFMTTHKMVMYYLKLRFGRFMWNRILSPLYLKYERKVTKMIENGEVQPDFFALPTRLMYFQPDIQIEDRYDYGHYER